MYDQILTYFCTTRYYYCWMGQNFPIPALCMFITHVLKKELQERIYLLVLTVVLLVYTNFSDDFRCDALCYHRRREYRKHTFGFSDDAQTYALVFSIEQAPHLRPPMDFSIQAVRNKTTRGVEGAQQRNDLFLQAVAHSREVYAQLESQGRTLTSEEVRVCRKLCCGCCCCWSCSFQSLLWYRRRFCLATPQRHNTECCWCICSRRRLLTITIITVVLCTTYWLNTIFIVLLLLQLLSVVVLFATATVGLLSSTHPWYPIAFFGC